MKQEAEQMSIFDQDLWCGKTSPELSTQTEEKISERCCTKRSKLPAITPPLFLCLETSGQKADASLTWTENGALLGEFSMRSFGEYPNVVAESHLSQILEDNPHPKYSLSAKACQGILRRAERRGKELPPILKNALEQQVFGTQNGYDQPTIIQETYIDKSDTAMVCMATQQGGAEIRTDDKAPTLTAAAGMSGNNQPVICIQGNCIDRAETAGCNGKGWTEGVSYTLNTIDRPCVVFNEEAITSKLNASNPHFGDACHTLGATGAGRTLLIQEDNNPFVPSPPQSDVVVFEPGSCSRVGGNIWQDGKAPALRAQSGDNQPAIALENHPNDSRIKLSKDNVVQTLSKRMGTGGGQHTDDT